MAETFQRVLERYLTRREAIVAAGAVLAAPFVLRGQTGRLAGLEFEPIEPSTADGTTVAAGHQVQVLLRWGDPLFPYAPAFDPRRQTAAAQSLQFGYNCDYVGFLPLPFGGNSSNSGLLVVNHEYAMPELMFEGDPLAPTAAETEVMLAAHGLSVVEIERNGNGQWSVRRDSKFNRRITGSTPFRISGPAAGHPWLRTSGDPMGTTILGTLNNCSGGKTPWGTVLSGEENFHFYFGNTGKLDAADPRRDVHLRYGLPLGTSENLLDRHIRRFDVSKEPNEPFRFGWVVEIDPYDPTSVPKKRTALGRCKHEAANFMAVAGRPVAVYSGDDERFECVYKFVSARPWDPADRKANLDLLDDGVLHVARFKDDGTGEWLPLLQGQGPLTPDNGFRTKGDVLINVRTAADLVGGTQMDRPEDIEIHPQTRKVYIVLTNNDLRGGVGRPRTDAANPRRVNKHGHIIELTEDGNDPAATRFSWKIFLFCGDPQPSIDPKKLTRISSPDNLTFDLGGNLWIATDGQPKSIKVNDGLFVMPTEGGNPKPLAQFFAAVKGAEVCGPEFTPDNTSLFLAIQHPGEGGTYRDPVSQWPDGQSPPRPSVVVITAEHGGRVGSRK